MADPSAALTVTGTTVTRAAPTRVLRNVDGTYTVIGLNGVTAILAGTQGLKIGTPVVVADPAAAGTPGGYITSAVTTLWMQGLMSQCLYAGLLASDPRGTEDPTSSELTFPLYARQPVTWIQPSGNLIMNSTALVWPGLLAGSRIAAVGFFGQPAGGDLLAAAYTSDVGGVLSASTFAVASGGLFLGLDVT